MEVININRNQFEEMVHSGKTVLVEFSAPWCVYCRRLAPSLESVAEEYKDTLVWTEQRTLEYIYSYDPVVYWIISSQICDCLCSERPAF